MRCGKVVVTECTKLVCPSKAKGMSTTTNEDYCVFDRHTIDERSRDKGYLYVMKFTCNNKRFSNLASVSYYSDSTGGRGGWWQRWEFPGVGDGEGEGDSDYGRMIRRLLAATASH